MYGRDSNDIQLVRADIQIDGPTIFVSFCQAEEGWPFIIENISDYTFSMAQIVSFQELFLLLLHYLTGRPFCKQDSSKTKSAYTLAPHSHLDYAWDSPAAREKKLSLTINDARRLVDPMEIGDLVPFRFQVFIQLR